MLKRKNAYQIFIPILLLLLFFIIISIFQNRKLTDSELEVKYQEIKQQLSNESSTSFLESANTTLDTYTETLKAKESFDVIHAKVKLLLIVKYNYSKEYLKSCNLVKEYIEITEINLDASTLGNARVDPSSATSLLLSSTKCSEFDLSDKNQILKITGLQIYENDEVVTLVYYDNLNSNNGINWIAEIFKQDIAELKLDDDKYRDAIRILVFTKNDFKPLKYYQFRSDMAIKSYFDRQFDTFYLTDAKLYWKYDNKLAISLENILDNE